MMKRKICVVTGSRADYGLLKLVISQIDKDDSLILQLLVTGSHLSNKFGKSVNEISLDGFKIAKKIQILSSDNSKYGIISSISKGLNEFSKAFKDLKPDIILVLGDRFELLSAVIPALIFTIPVAHIHGGEKTLGAFDEAIRHSITKMSQIHFAATEVYRKRLIQLGENPNNVYLVGGLGVDRISQIKLLSKSELENRLKFKFGDKNLLVTFHPETLEKKSSKMQIKELLDALSEFPNITQIFTMPNADPDSLVISKQIAKYVKKNTNAYAFKSMGFENYISCMSHIDGVVGNSSSGILEASYLHKGTVNIGDRQKGRVRSNCVIDCKMKKSDIIGAVEFLFSNQFIKKLRNIDNPYGNGGASKKIVKVLKKIDLDILVKKEFFDIKQFESEFNVL